jgi:hypothetical protein
MPLSAGSAPRGKTRIVLREAAPVVEERSLSVYEALAALAGERAVGSAL